MSSALAVASVTAILKSLLENGLVDHGISASVGSDVIVSALPPDRVDVGADERAQLNLFLHQITPNTNLRAPGRLVLDADERQAAAPRLALDLHYLLTAYGAQDFQIEILLGYAIQRMHQAPTLKRDAMRASLKALSTSDHGNVLLPALAALASSNLAEQVEQIAITPQFLNSDEMSKIWSALQARYRPSIAYKVSMVLFEDAL
jgi:Pvc16 N-terminal domain